MVWGDKTEDGIKVHDLVRLENIGCKFHDIIANMLQLSVHRDKDQMWYENTKIDLRKKGNVLN